MTNTRKDGEKQGVVVNVVVTDPGYTITRDGNILVNNEYPRTVPESIRKIYQKQNNPKLFSNDQ